MRPSARHDTILQHLTDRGAMSIADLAAKVNASEVTVRRDLTALANRGLLRRTRGGAVPVPNGTAEFVFDRVRRSANLEAKRAIGQAAASRVQPGQSLSLDTGTTTLEVARCLPRSANLRVLTSSLAIASLLQTREDIELILLGGAVRRGSPDLYGLVTELNLREFRVDLAVIGADAVGPDGLFTTDQRIAQVSQVMVESAAAVCLVADASKLSARALVRFAGWDKIQTIVTDVTLRPQDKRWLDRLTVELVIAESKDEETGHG